MEIGMFETMQLQALLDGEENIFCTTSSSRYSRKEPFSSVAVDIRNCHTLMDSLAEYVKGDLLEGGNQYHCDKCDAKVDAVKRLCFDELPKVLTIQLKRFHYDWER